jgi:radical SAM superfamily enzyme YgiQ (UPF0313 family)
MVDHERLTFGPKNSCKKEWWDEWGSFSKDIIRALQITNKREKVPVYRYLKVDNGKEFIIEIKPDFVTRTAKIFANKKEVKTLDRAGLAGFESLLYGPNYYADGHVKKIPKGKNGEYIDRGNGEYYSYETGLKDPYKKEGAVKALKSYFNDIAHAR